MNDKLFILEAQSPQELEAFLTSTPKDKKIDSRFVELSIYGPGVLVRQFELPYLAARELNNTLKLEVVELLSLLPTEIELDYQILDYSEGKIKGVFVAIPKN